MPAPPSSAQTAAKNAVTRTNYNSGGNTQSTSGKSSAASRSVPSSQGANTRSPSGVGSTAGRVPGSSAAAAKSSGASNAQKSVPSSSQSKTPSTTTRSVTPSGKQNSSPAPRGPGASLAAAAALSKVSSQVRGVNANTSKFGPNSSQSGGVSQPRSIQGMINANSGQIAPNGSYYGPKGGSRLGTAALNAATRSPQTAGNGSYYGPKGINALNTPARYAAAHSQNYYAAPIQRVAGDSRTLGRMMEAESNIIKNEYGKPNTAGWQGVGDVIRNRVLSSQFPDNAVEVMYQGSKTKSPQFSPFVKGKDGRTLFDKTPGSFASTSVAEAILSGEQPPIVGNTLNYHNEYVVNNKKGYSSPSTKKSVGGMVTEYRIADARNPNQVAHSFGTRGAESDVTFGGYDSAGNAYTAPSATANIADSKPPAVDPGPRWETSPVPKPNSMIGDYQWGRQVAPVPNMRPPSQNMQTPPGWTPQAPAQFADGGVRKSIPGYMPPQAQPPVPNMRPPSQNMQKPVGGMSFTPGLPGQMPISQNMLPPPGWQPPARESLSAPETYVDPSTGVARNPFDTQRGITGAGMSFTPGLPGPQKQYYDRVAQTPGPQQPYQLPAYPGQSAAGTYTAPYDVPNRQAAGTYTEPYNVRGPALKGMEKLTELPPGYAERYLQAPDEQTYSDNPMQGPSNPSQEEQDPRVVQERRDKYSKTGATVGGIIAGPLGAIAGGIIGDQMGKTPPRVKRQIAGSPQALKANADSINRLFAQSGGKDLDHQVTERGLRDVLIDPDAVLADPESYTTLEEMLAALSKGIDPETGKPL